MTELLTEFNDVFAWSYKDMSGIDRSIAEHRIPIKPGFKPVKQKRRRIKPEWSLMVKEEIEKQLQAGIIQVIEYSDWVSNMVPMLKKNGKIRVRRFSRSRQSKSQRRLSSTACRRTSQQHRRSRPPMLHGRLRRL
ncbi:hypothetical protein RND81_14G230700 [Saponaria officinalis]|uniref:Uncharacterized protein n=1 Tax=Saponaria officinalis TaxID=3572 RepID=A0AAW1GVH3_SAPOF